MSDKQQTMGFQAEVKQMLHLVVHSLYSNKEIFLRELISNASDALDKLRFLSLSNSGLYEKDPDLKITIEFNQTLKTLTIIDNGIGMTRDEAIGNLGTIAKSGTKEFLSQLSGENARDSQLIGQFGVGFYSAFIVADKVTVESRKAGMSPEEGIVWESEGTGEFTIAQKNKETRGTRITLHLKSEEAEDLLADWRLRGLVTKYSDHICWPIVMQKIKSSEEDKKDDKQIPEFETVNKATALWTLQKSEISDDEYKALYKHISHDQQDPLAWSHNHVEGKQDYISLLYVPAHAPYDLWHPETKNGLKLYVKRVFIMDDASQFLPRYLRFIKGVVDASDLPLNVSRELLQDNKQVESIRNACVKRVLSMLEKMSENEPETYQKFWDAFGLVLKEGPVEDFANRETLAGLMRFASTSNDSDAQTVTLKDYVARMKEGQDKIYYITAANYLAAKHSPHLEIFKKKGIEVLLLSDKIDEWLVNYMGEFEGKAWQSISKGKLDLADDEATKEAVEAKEKTMEPLLNHMKKVLSEQVKTVQVTTRLTDSPACIVADENDLGLEMQRILQATGQKMPKAQPILEINPDHPLIKRLHDIQDDALFEQWTLLLLQQAILAESGHLENPVDFVHRLNQLLLSA